MNTAATDESATPTDEATADLLASLGLTQQLPPLQQISGAITCRAASLFDGSSVAHLHIHPPQSTAYAPARTWVVCHIK